MSTGEGLNKPDQGVINRLIAVGVVFAQDVADDAGALAVWPVWGEPQFLRCTGFKPSRASGKALPTITLMAYSR